MNRLFNELKIGNLRIANRICIPPLVMGYARDGFATKETIEHYRTLAKGGAGLIIQEATCIHPDAKLSENQLGIWSDEQIVGLKSIVEAVHSENVPILLQIHHAGVVGISKEPLCPSAYTWAGPNGSVTGREMSLEDIHSIQADFVKAAKRAVEAGYDGIELHGCHAYLISQFLNRKVNKRTDEYGTRRELFALEILAEIRKNVPENFIVGIRLGGFEPTLEAGLAYAKIFADNGVDFIDVSYGFYHEQEVTVENGWKESAAVYAAKKVKETVSVPVFAVNSISSAQQAERILNDTGVDMVDIGRGFLVNPTWGSDARVGRDTGKCLQCQKCHWRGQIPACPGREILKKSKTA